MFDEALFGKIIVTLLLILFGLMYCLFDDRKSYRSFVIKICSLFIIVRIGIFILVFTIWKLQPQSDIIYYYNWGLLVNDGHVPGESEILPLHYGPLFLYIIGFLLRIWDDPKVIILFSILSECVLFVVWLSIGTLIYDVLAIKRASALYTFCPISVLTSAVNGNNDVFAGMFVSIFVASAIWSRPTFSGIAAGVSVIASKGLTALAGLPVFLASEYKLLWLFGAIVPIVMTYSIWEFVLSINIFDGFQFHESQYSSGNVPFLIGLFGIDVITSSARWIVNVIGVFFIVLVGSLPLLANKTFARRDIVPIIASTIVMFLIVSAKSFPHYILIALFPIMIIVAEMKVVSRMIVYCIISFLTSIESSLWFRIFNYESPIAMTASNRLIVFSFGVVEIILLAAYGTVLWRCIQNYVKVLCARWLWPRMMPGRLGAIRSAERLPSTESIAQSSDRDS